MNSKDDELEVICRVTRTSTRIADWSLLLIGVNNDTYLHQELIPLRPDSRKGEMDRVRDQVPGNAGGVIPVAGRGVKWQQCFFFCGRATSNVLLAIAGVQSLTTWISDEVVGGYRHVLDSK